MIFKLFVSTLLFITGCQNILAQDFKTPEQREVLNVFELFFTSMRERDTTTLKSIILYPGSPDEFFVQFSGNNQRIAGGSNTSAKGFIKSVISQDSNFGKCRNKFEDISIDVYQRYAILSCIYTCYLNKDQPENLGKYTIQFIKRDRWRIERVFRYIKIENENFPSSALTNGILKCPDINLLFQIPELWNEIGVEEMFLYGYGTYKIFIINDSLKVKSQLLIGIMKKDPSNRIMIYVSEPKYGGENYFNLPETCRVTEIKRYQSGIESGRNKRLTEFTFDNEKQTIAGIDFYLTSQQKSFDNNEVVENLSYDALINGHLLSVDCVIRDPALKDEIVSILQSIKFDN